MLRPVCTLILSSLIQCFCLHWSGVRVSERRKCFFLNTALMSRNYPAQPEVNGISGCSLSSVYIAVEVSIENQVAASLCINLIVSIGNVKKIV